MNHKSKQPFEKNNISTMNEKTYWLIIISIVLILSFISLLFIGAIW